MNAFMLRDMGGLRGVGYAIALLLAGALSHNAHAQSFQVDWSTIDSGATLANTAGTFRVDSSIGQPDAMALAGPTFQVQGGFWPGALSDDGPPPTPTPTPTRTPSPRGDTDRDGFDDAYENLVGTDPEDPGSRPPFGDVNADGTTNILDATLLYRIVTGRLSFIPLNDADIDGNGILDETDALLLYLWATGQNGVTIIPLQ